MLCTPLAPRSRKASFRAAAWLCCARLRLCEGRRRKATRRSASISSASACDEPIRQISGNGGWEGAIIIEKIRASKEKNFGFNAATGEYEDLVKAGVIDPTKVTRSALQNAASISALMLTTEAMICEIPEKKSAPMPGGEHGGPGGMDY